MDDITSISSSEAEAWKKLILTWLLGILGFIVQKCVFFNLCSESCFQQEPASWFQKVQEIKEIVASPSAKGSQANVLLLRSSAQSMKLTHYKSVATYN